MRGRGVRTVSTSLGAARTHTEIDWTGPRAVVVGPEAAGLGAPRPRPPTSPSGSRCARPSRA